MQTKDGRRKQKLAYENARALQIQEETLKKQRAIEIKQAEDESKRLQDAEDEYKRLQDEADASRQKAEELKQQAIDADNKRYEDLKILIQNFMTTFNIKLSSANTSDKLQQVSSLGNNTLTRLQTNLTRDWTSKNVNYDNVKRLIDNSVSTLRTKLEEVQILYTTVETKERTDRENEARTQAIIQNGTDILKHNTQLLLEFSELSARFLNDIQNYSKGSGNTLKSNINNINDMKRSINEWKVGHQVLAVPADLEGTNTDLAGRIKQMGETLNLKINDTLVDLDTMLTTLDTISQFESQSPPEVESQSPPEAEYIDQKYYPNNEGGYNHLRLDFNM